MDRVEYKKSHKVITAKTETVVKPDSYKVIKKRTYKAVVGEEFDDKIKAFINIRADIDSNTSTIANVGTNLDDEIEARLTQSSSLTSRINDAESSIISNNNLITSESQTRASADEIVKSTLRGEITSEVQTINQTIASNQQTSATSITNLRSDMNDGDSAISDGLYGTSGAVTQLRTFVGVTGDAGLSQDIEILKKQNDGKVETTANTHDVIVGTGDTAEFLNASEPYASWKSAESTESGKEQDVRHSHIGDVYVKYSTEPNGSKRYIASYKFIKAQIDVTSPYSTDPQGFTWALIVDQVAQAAYEAALNAQALADGKITTFFAPRSNPPLAESEGDMWVVSDEGNLLERWNGLVWVNIQDQGISSALSNAQTAQDTADGKIESFYQLSPPVTASEGDLWFDTDDGNKIYTYRSNTWTNTQDSKIGVALLNAASAQSTADGKITTFYQPTAPIAEGVGDLWVNTGSNNEAYRWDSTSWVSIKDQDIVANSTALTELDAYLRDGLGTVGGATSTVEQSIDTKVLDGDLSVQSKWAYNSNISIGGVHYNSGFGLNALATGGDGSEGNPYDSEFWIDAEKFKFTNSANSGQVSPFTIDTSGVTPQVSFNGVVTFSNVDGRPTHTSGAGVPTSSEVDGSTYVDTATDPDTLYTRSSGEWLQGGNPDAITAEDLSFTGSTVVDAGRITTGQVDAARINTADLVAENIKAETFKVKTEGNLDTKPIIFGVTSGTAGGTVTSFSFEVRVFSSNSNYFEASDNRFGKYANNIVKLHGPFMFPDPGKVFVKIARRNSGTSQWKLQSYDGSSLMEEVVLTPGAYGTHLVGSYAFTQGSIAVGDDGDLYISSFNDSISLSGSLPTDRNRVVISTVSGTDSFFVDPLQYEVVNL